MKAHLFALAALVCVAACGHNNATTQQQTTTRAAGAPGSTSHDRSAGGTAGSGGGYGGQGAYGGRTGANGSRTGGMQGSRRGGAGGNQPPEFATEAAATRHCGGDEVVWLNLKSGVYHAKGSEFYGNTKNGAFACRREADAAGDRASKGN